MNQGIIYLLTGPRHAARLVVSLRSLRAWYDGPITLFTTEPDSHTIGRLCAEDPRLAVEHREIHAVRARKNSAYLTKVMLPQHTPYETTVFLDADTTVEGPIDALFDVSPTDQFLVTQFVDWQTWGRTIRKRLERWRTLDLEHGERIELDGLVDEAIAFGPAINVGVFAFRRDADILGPWHDLARLGRNTFICDEIACQLLLPCYPHRVLDSRYNCSAKHDRDTRDVRIRHFHGDKHVRTDEARHLWWPHYERCLEENTARLAEWTPGSDRHLAEFSLALHLE